MKYQSVRGASDILPEEAKIWQFVFSKSRQVFSRYNYQEIILPVIEDAALFKRSLGQDSEVVDKQMFLIERQDTVIALRPEGTASTVRAYLEHSLDRKSPFVKLFYIGPMFRAERPQKGRLRQFNHIGAEVIGSKSPFIDAEIISMCSLILEAIGIIGFNIRLNSLGSINDKIKFAEILRENLGSKIKSFCTDCQNRFQRNVFRLLDCKNESCRKIIESLRLSASSYMSEESLQYFEKVRNSLDALGIKYTYDPFLVRGLDYYTSTVFEITHSSLGAQDAIGAGGRYDNLVKELGGTDMPAMGFALGVERLMLAINNKDIGRDNHELILYLAALGDEAMQKSLVIADGLRKDGVNIEVDFEDRRLDKKISRASKLGARFLGILAENELKNKIIALKNLTTGEQKEVNLDIKKIKEELC